MPREVALQALLYCDQLEAEIEQGDTAVVMEKLHAKFQGWLDDFKPVDATVALSAIRALANESLRDIED